MCIRDSGDTSTNDTFSIMASGLAGNALIDDPDSENAQAFEALLEYVCHYLARKMAADGEGATKLLECRVHGCDTVENARILAKSVINSPLVKTAMFGADANWGRILCALGYACLLYTSGLQVLAFPLLQIAARAIPFFRCSRVTVIGAP